MGFFDGKQKPKTDSSKPVRLESVLLREFWSVARDNFTDYVDHATRAEVHKLNVATVVKPDALTDEAYA
jgi:hypothetical protein